MSPLPVICEVNCTNRMPVWLLRRPSGALQRLNRNSKILKEPSVSFTQLYENMSIRIANCLPIEITRLKKVSKIYEKRREYTKAIDKFWHIVLSQHPEFADYVRAQDFKYLELIKDIYVSWDASTSTDESVDPTTFSITFEFEQSEDGDFPAQTVTKRFQKEVIDPEELQILEQKRKKGSLSDDEDGQMPEETERLVSTNTEIIWPKSYDSINPSKVVDKKTTLGKKNYRAGMKSFFGWFRWTGRKPGKEFPNGDDFARLFADDIFPSAVLYYTEAQRDGLEEEMESDASEPLDLSDSENVPRGLKRKLD